MPKISRMSAQVQDYGPVEERREDCADTTAQFLTMKEDVDGAPLFKGLPDDRCSCPHWAGKPGALVNRVKRGRPVLSPSIP